MKLTIVRSKHRINSILAAVSTTLLLAASSHATVIFTDTFDSGTGDWYRGGTNGTLVNSGSQLSWAPATAGATGSDLRSVIGRSFTAQTVGVGGFIRLTADYTQNSGTTSAADIIRLGIFDVSTPISANAWSQPTDNVADYSGYSGFFRDNSATGNQLRFESFTDTGAFTNGPTGLAGNTTIASDTDLFNIVAGTQYKFSLELSRASLTQMDVLFKLTSMDGLTTHQTLSGSTTSVVDTFDAVIFRSLNGAGYNGSLLDNVTLEIVPEPSVISCLGLGLAGLLIVNKRRR